MTNLRALNWLFFPAQSILAWGLLCLIGREKSAFLAVFRRKTRSGRAAGGARSAKGLRQSDENSGRICGRYPAIAMKEDTLCAIIDKNQNDA